MKALIVFVSDVRCKNVMFDEFWEGAEVFGLKTLLTSFPGKRTEIN